jgi:hypothetical protein
MIHASTGIGGDRTVKTLKKTTPICLLMSVSSQKQTTLAALFWGFGAASLQKHAVVRVYTDLYIGIQAYS